MLISPPPFPGSHAPTSVGFHLPEEAIYLRKINFSHHPFLHWLIYTLSNLSFLSTPDFFTHHDTC